MPACEALSAVEVVVVCSLETTQPCKKNQVFQHASTVVQIDVQIGIPRNKEVEDAVGTGEILDQDWDNV